MTKIACVGTPGGNGCCNVRAIDRVASHRLHQAQRCVWHVAVVTVTASGVRCMMSMQRQLLFRFEVLVALKTGIVPAHLWLHLVIGPLFHWPRIVLARVHVVTGETGHRAVLEA